MSGPIRVAFIADSSEYGGAERYLVGLAGALPDRFAIDLIATAPIPHELLEPIRSRGGRVLSTRSVAGKADLRALSSLVGALRVARPQLVHVNLNSFANNRHAIALAALAWPTVATVHIATELSSRLQRSLLSLAFARLGRVIAVSEEIADHLRADLRVPDSRIAVVSNGVESAAAVAIRDDPSPLRIGGLGRLTAQKGFDVLIGAVAILQGQGIPVEAVIAGDGPERKALTKLADGLPVRLPGWASDPAELLAGLDVFCLPSRWEGLPFALLEAMVRGLPCVCTPVGDVASAAAGACVLVDPDDAAQLAAALRELAGSAERRRALGAAARQRALARYSVGQMAAATAAHYDEVLSGR